MTSPIPWSTSDPISVAPADSREPAVTTAGETLHLLWTKDKVIYHSARTAEVWSAPVLVACGEQPALATTPDGRVHCLFVNQFAGNYEIYYVWWNGAAWSLPQPVSRTTGGSQQPSLAVAPDGSLHATWADTTPGFSTIYHGQSDPIAWSSEPIPNGRGSAPAIAVTPNGDVYLAWQDRQLDTLRYEVYGSILHGETWSLPDIVSDTPNSHSLQPRLATNAQGGCHMVWQEESDGIYRVQHADWRGGGWSTPVDVSATEADCRLARIAAIRQGLLEVIWAEGPALRHRVRPSDYDATWWNPEIAPDAYAGLCELALAISRAGRVHVVSCQVEASGVRRLYYTQREPLYKHTTFAPVG
ncbi:MAG: hypothetical protein NT169_20615 [Chloroflexi bacterium]|nr:hypothetical protein [Chloroflexota bacterium]